MSLRPAYEVHNPSFNDIGLEQQIEFGINDWCAESGIDGHKFFGRSAAEAEAIRASVDSGRRPRLTSHAAALADRCCGPRA